MYEQELQFYYQEGSSWVYPDYFDAFRNHIPKDEQHDLMQAYHKCVLCLGPSMSPILCLCFFSQPGMILSPHSTAV